MRMQLLTDNENPVLKRRELVFSLEYDGKSTTSKAEMQQAVSTQLKSSIDSVEITKIISEVGTPRGKAWVKIWKDKKVPNYAEAKKKPAEGAAPAEAPKEEAKQ